MGGYQFFLISDHGQLKFTGGESECILAEAGLLRIEGGRVTDWDACAFPAECQPCL